MLPRCVWVGLIAGSMLGNGCTSSQLVSISNLPGETIEELLPPSKNVLLERRSGEVIKARVKAATDSTVVLVQGPDRLIGHGDSMVVDIDDIESVRVLGTNPLQYVLLGIGLSFVAFVVYFAIAWGNAWGS